MAPMMSPFEHTVAVALCFAALGVSDLILGRICPDARWYVIHATANMIVAAISARDAVLASLDPKESCSGEYTQATLHMIAVLHFYHLVAFKKVSLDEWVHHIVFAGSICSVGFYWESGPVQNLLAFFICGLPGGLDYMMLAAVKMGKMARENEKKWNARINVWIRSPGLCWSAFTIYAATLYSDNSACKLNPWPAFLIAALAILNGQYYLQVVVGNTFRKVEKYNS